MVFTNEKLSRIGLVESPSCTFCQEVEESVENPLFSCRTSADFWKHVLSWLRDNNVLVGTIDHFTVVYLVAWPLNEGEAGGDLALIETLLLFLC